MQRGYLPNLKALIGDGVRGVLDSTIPSHSWAAWTTFLTGLNPGDHGIFDFVERRPGQLGKRIPVTSSSISTRTFLEVLSDNGHEVRAANIPVTFPVIPVRGRMIGGCAVPPGAEFVYPSDWARELASKHPFPTNGLEWAQAKGDPAALVAEALELVVRRTDSYDELLTGDWKVAVCVYVEPDRLQHPLGAYLLPTHPDHSRLVDSSLGEALRQLYQTLDAQIERLRALAGPEATTVFMSDHGFRPVTRTANLDLMLAELGFSERARGAPVKKAVRRSSLARRFKQSRAGDALRRRVRPPSTIDWDSTIAYKSAMGGGVSINVKGREPRGIVSANDYERVLAEVKQALLEFRDPQEGGSPVARVLTKEELYHGRFQDVAPDLFVLPSDLWTLAHTDRLTDYTDWPTGAHRHAGVLAAAGGRAATGGLARHDIFDVSASALAFAGISVRGLDGKPIPEIVGSASATNAVPIVPVERRGEELSSDEQEHIARHLHDLGYIE
jgi:predicted AlkP superfamily phosphohydrolase/phosphomutase